MKIIYMACFKHRRVFASSGWQSMMQELEHNFDIRLVAALCDKCEVHHEKKLESIHEKQTSATH